MNSISIGRAVTATIVTMILAACGGGGGDDGGSAPPPQNPPQNPPPQTPSNAAPVPNAGADQSVDLPTDTTTLTGSATDDALPTGSSIAYTWEFVTGPLGPNNSPGAVFASPNAASTSVRLAGGKGDYTFKLKASDGAATGEDTLIVSLKTNPNAYPAAGFAAWPSVTPDQEQMNIAKLDEAKAYSMSSALNTPESGLIVRHGRVVYQWGSPTLRYEMKSTTKSMGGLALLLALDEGKLALTDKVNDKLPSGVFGTNPPVGTAQAPAGASLNDITVLHLATHTSGLSKSDDSNPPSTLELRFTAGSTWSYSDQGLNWLADTLTTVYAQDLNALLFARIYSKLGISATDLIWRNNAFRSVNLDVNGTPTARRELASGINANMDAMARVGLLMLRKGVWGDELLLSNAIVAKASTPTAEDDAATIAIPADFPSATQNYGMLWWTNGNKQMPDVPADAFWAWGLHDTLIIVVPSLDLVITRAGERGWRDQAESWNADYSELAPFLTPIVQSITP